MGRLARWQRRWGTCRAAVARMELDLGPDHTWSGPPGHLGRAGDSWPSLATARKDDTALERFFPVTPSFTWRVVAAETLAFAWIISCR